MGNGWRRAAAAGVLALGLVSAACGGGGGGNDPSTPPGTTDGQETTAPASPCPEGGNSVATVKQVHFSFDPAHLSVSRCDTITLTNQDATTHTFTVPDSTINLTNSRGGQQDVTIDLAPGEHIFYCAIHGHPDGTGMAGKITVS